MLYPMAALVVLTFVVALLMLRERIRAVKSHQVSLGYFRVYENKGTELPARMLVTQRCFQNLLEIPPLFYIACLAAMVLGYEGAVSLTLAWVYVLCRVWHVFIHLGANNVLWRMRVFLLGNLVLLALWGLLVAGQLTAGL